MLSTRFRSDSVIPDVSPLAVGGKRDVLRAEGSGKDVCGCDGLLSYVPGSCLKGR